MNNRLIRIFIGIALVVVTGCSNSANDPGSTSSESETTTPQTNCEKMAAGYIFQVQDGVFEVCEFDSTYTNSNLAATGLPDPIAAVSFSSYGIGVTRSENTLNHPASGASDGTKLAIADRFNNRVLVYNTLPTSTTPPDVVVGQPNFTDITPGNGLADLNWPGAIEMTPDGKLLIADTENGRVLVYLSTPTTNGAAADFALDFATLTGNTDAWPWGIWSDGTSLIVTDTRRGDIVVWDTFPTSANAMPSTVSNAEVVGTPRNITSDGTNFLIGDENGKQSSCWGEQPIMKGRQSHIWINRLPIGEPDGCIWNWYQGATGPKGLIALAAAGGDVHYWPSFPIDEASASNVTRSGANNGPIGAPTQPGTAGQPVAPGAPVGSGQPVAPGASVPAGQPVAPGAPVAGAPQAPLANIVETHSYLGGDGGDVVVTDSAIYFIEYNGNRVTGWTQWPDDIVSKAPDFSLFETDPKVSTLLRDGLIQNPLLVNANGVLVATSDYDRRMHVWKTSPTQSGATADFIYLTGFPAWDNTFANGTLIIGGRDSIAYWNTFKAGALPDAVISKKVGTLEVNDIRGVAYDGTYFAVSDAQSGVVAVFEGIPTTDQIPMKSYNVNGPGRIDMKDGMLVIAPKEGQDVLLVDVTSSAQPKKLPVKANLPQQARFLPQGFALVDFSNHRVMFWPSVQDAQSGADPSLIIGGEPGDRPQITDSRLFMPFSVESIGGQLLIGEFKFSNRILGYTLK